ncbi:ubiquinone/menaquinone biosynthesis C-methylase UbiE [Desulfohalotomaculum tongense]|uniref:DVU_1556 family methyltransferase n=1 Tax=Desulforadius tongensis TaxID=1216062 RepID=UPI00195805EA|nr:ubiquinone/menaquinone biosynthesis C-methylase UbiE [Desulforadius tongensis]
MALKEICRVYEGRAVRQVTGKTVRPGGFTLTDRAVAYCSFSAGARVLDVGCGTGATVERLLMKYRLDAVGVDPSPLMLSLGRKRNCDLPLVMGRGESLPFASGEMDGVFAECTLSLMEDLKQTLQQIHRVLKENGRLVVSDVYTRKECTGINWHNFPMDCCLNGARTKQAWLDEIISAGFEILQWEDHSELLKDLAVKLIFAHGSMINFWQQVLKNAERGREVQKMVNKAKVGYFLLIARRL